MAEGVNMIKWNALVECEKRKFERMNEVQKFIFFLLKQFGSPYGWGRESPEASDCSGAVCMALFAATGLLIRTTADDLYKRVFTVTNPRPDTIRAIFFITKKNQKPGDRMVAAGTATHIAGILENGILFNSQEPYAKVRQIIDVSNWYQNNGYEVAVRGLNREALARLAGEGKTVYDLDPEFYNYFDVGGKK
jgi:murein DD-endopeptidase